MQLERPRWFNNEFMRRYRVYVVHPPPAERLKRLFRAIAFKVKTSANACEESTKLRFGHHQKVRGAE